MRICRGDPWGAQTTFLTITGETILAPIVNDLSGFIGAEDLYDAERGKRNIMIYDQIDRAIEKHRDVALALLQELVRIPSLEGAEKPCMDVLERKLRAMSLEVDRWIPDDDELAAHPAYVPTGWSYAERPNVVGICRGAGGGRVAEAEWACRCGANRTARALGAWTLERRFRRWQGLWTRQRRYEGRRRQQCA